MKIVRMCTLALFIIMLAISPVYASTHIMYTLPAGPHLICAGKAYDVVYVVHSEPSQPINSLQVRLYNTMPYSVLRVHPQGYSIDDEWLLWEDLGGASRFDAQFELRFDPESEGVYRRWLIFYTTSIYGDVHGWYFDEDFFYVTGNCKSKVFLPVVVR